MFSLTIYLQSEFMVAWHTDRQLSSMKIKGNLLLGLMEYLCYIYIQIASGFQLESVRGQLQ